MSFNETHRKKILIYVSKVGALLFFCGASSVFAAEYQYAIFQNIEHSDNVGQSTAPEGGSIYSGGVQFRVNSIDSLNYEASVSGILAVSKFDGLDIDTRYDKGFQGNLLLRPNRTNFSLLLLDSYAQVPQNRFVTQRVDNTADVHVYGAIPKYYINLSSIDKLNFEYSYSVVDDRDAILDIDNASKVYSEASVGYERLFSVVSSVGLFYQEGKIEFDSQIASFEVKEAYLNWSYNRDLTRFEINIGKTETLAVESGEEVESDLVEFAVSRTITKQSEFNIRYRDGIGQAIGLDLNGSVGDVTANDQAGFSQDPLLERQFDLGFRRDSYLLDFSLFFSLRELESVDELVDRNETSKDLDVSFNFDIGALLESRFTSDVQLSYRVEKREFDVTDSVNKISTLSLRANYYTSEQTIVYGEYRRRSAEQNIPLLETTENVYLVGISYSPRGRLKVR